MERTIKSKVCLGQDGMYYDETTGNCTQRILPNEATSCDASLDDTNALGGFVDNISVAGRQYQFGCSQKNNQATSVINGNCLTAGAGKIKDVLPFSCDLINLQISNRVTNLGDMCYADFRLEVAGTPPVLDLVPTSSGTCLLYTSPSPRDATLSRMPSSA